VQGEKLMEADSKALRTVKRLAVLLPLLALPLVPALGQGGANMLLQVVLQHNAAQ
jgi:hypothetical protein